MTIRLAQRLQGVTESATLKLNAMVQELRARGEDVVNLTAGEPDFDVPEAAKEAVIGAVRANRSKYTPVAGIPELRKLIAAKTNAQQPSVQALHGPWKPEHVVVSNGGKQVIFNAIQALVDPGDEVLIPSPYWLSYPEMTLLAGGKPRFIAARPEARFKITPSQLRDAVRSGKPRLLLINSPSNPTGQMYSRSELAALGHVLLEEKSARETWVLSDEIYDRLVFGGTPFCSFLEACPELRERVITVNGMSKSAAMTGWRVGWSVAQPEITQALSMLQGQSTSGINALAQWASVAALQLPEAHYAPQLDRYRKRRDLALEILGKAGKIKTVAPEGAFYIFAGIGACLKSGEDSIAFCERVLGEAKVALVPGTPFGSPDHVRLSFATDDRMLQEGCERLVRYVAS
jgi:aspartate aminotransferase